MASEPVYLRDLRHRVERKELGSHELPAKRERDMRRAAEALRKLYTIREAG